MLNGIQEFGHGEINVVITKCYLDQVRIERLLVPGLPSVYRFL